MSDTSATIQSGRLRDGIAAHTYAPSWVDRFTDFLDRSPGPVWVYYLLIWLIPITAAVLVKWIDGTYDAPFVNPLHIALAAGIGYIMADIALLDYVARSALAIFRPGSTLTEDEFEAFEYRLTTLPARPTLLWSVIPLVLVAVGMGSVVLFHLTIFDADVKRLALFTSSLSAVTDGLSLLAWPPLFGIWYYHTYHQLKVVDELYIGYTKIDPFYLKPLYAFARLTAYTAISLLIPTYFGPLTVPGYLGDPIFMADTVGLLIISVFAIALFIWPLLGIHHLLIIEKEKLLVSSAKRIESAIAEFDRRIDAGELQAMDKMKDTMDALVTKQAFIDKIPTWPWSTETSRLIASAVTLPFILYAVQRLLELIFRP